LRHSHFTLEITESQALRKTTSLMEVLGRLRLSGFALSIDDFGTGHSNLETLREFPFTEIKIDRSFVQEALSSASASASVEACLLLGREMGMTIVAEGVETKEHWQFLLSKGTTAAQGYFIAKPMSLRDMRSWMQQRAAMPAARAR
jgi:EAL domain-containing protein (putative c-di-GMP-specific phosphodiesterase class I)